MSESGGDIIIRKGKKSRHVHHGGAWKIAYADFVTAMMAFFLLLWLLSSVSEETLDALSEYFSPTIGLSGKMGIGFEGGLGETKTGVKKDITSSPSIILGAPKAGSVVVVPDTTVKDYDKIEQKNFTGMENDLYKAVHENPIIKEFSDSIKIDQTPEGLRIQLLDDDKRPMFKPGTTLLMPYTKEILKLVAKFIKFLPNYISIEGHTNSVVSNKEIWRLSAVRANVTRKFLANGLIDPQQTYRIVGKGDQDPIDRNNPASPSNMRISIILLKSSIVPYQKRVIPNGISLEKEIQQEINSAK